MGKRLGDARHRWYAAGVLLALAGLGYLGWRWQAGLPGTDPGDLGIGMKLVRIAPGKFEMGVAVNDVRRGSDQSPQREAVIPHGFYMGVTEVTQRQWQAVMGNNPSHFRGEDFPVECVSRADALAFCTALAGRTGRTVRLPTEAEWEYACRAGTTTPYAFGNDLSEQQANFRELAFDAGDDKRQGTKAVGSSEANAWGLHDMHGNVWEWCQDAYTSSPTAPQPGPEPCFVVRGGGWLVGALDCRSASRDGYPQASRCDFVGFRIVVE